MASRASSAMHSRTHSRTSSGRPAETPPEMQSRNHGRTQERHQGGHPRRHPRFNLTCRYQRSNWARSRPDASAIARRKSSQVTACPSWRLKYRSIPLRNVGQPSNVRYIRITCGEEGGGAVVSTCMQGRDSSGSAASRVVISGHQWSSVVISGHQSSSR